MALCEPDDDFEESTFSVPLPPDDRLWRHPSEVDDGKEERSTVGKLLASLFPRQRP